VNVEAKHDAAQTEQEPAPPRGADHRWKLALGALLGCYIALGIYYLISFPVAGPAASGAKPSVASPPATASTGPPLAVATPPALARPTASGPPAHALNVASVAAVGPEGTADGDNPGTAGRVIGETTGQPWYSQWYATPEFGALRTGTGLLLDLGETVSVRDVRLALGTTPGADVQVRVGDSPSLASLATVAGARDASGSVRLTAADQATGRYVLIWFTRLPPDSAGHYQVSVYRAAVDGSEQ
jgi:hypothetical protein